MNAHAHTPGPWEVIDRAQQHNTDALHRYLIMQPEGNNTFIAKTIKEYDSVDDLSNARLIAAAPDLLALAARGASLADAVAESAYDVGKHTEDIRRLAYWALDARYAIRAAQGE
jgi:hypothetical protein